ncbi:MAG: hypothetical protein KC549_17940 [Myxococcales bacterium]|nr:hypothetical protein [Myxococcales bacterium]
MAWFPTTDSSTARGRFLFGDGCGIAGEATYDFIGEVGERINGVPLAERDGQVGVDEAGELDLVFVSEITWDFERASYGVSRYDGGRTVVVSERTLRLNPEFFLLTLGHEIGHALGGFPEEEPYWTFAWDQDYFSPSCQSVDPDERHVMCDGDQPGVAIGGPTCARWYTKIESKQGPRNYSELCDSVDNDLDGEVDETLDCPW